MDAVVIAKTCTFANATDTGSQRTAALNNYATPIRVSVGSDSVAQCEVQQQCIPGGSLIYKITKHTCVCVIL